MKKLTGHVRLMSFDTGEGMARSIIPFDTFLQVIDGVAELIIGGNSQMIESGQSFIIPAHTSNQIKANQPFKMIMSVIKSGYE